MIANILRPIWGNCGFANPLNYVIDKEKLNCVEIVANKFIGAINTLNNEKAFTEAKIFKQITFLPLDSVSDCWSQMSARLKIYTLGYTTLSILAFKVEIDMDMSPWSASCNSNTFGKHMWYIPPNIRGQCIPQVFDNLLTVLSIISTPTIAVFGRDIILSFIKRIKEIPIVIKDLKALKTNEKKLKNAQCDFLLISKIDGLNADVISHIGQQIFDLALHNNNSSI